MPDSDITRDVVNQQLPVLAQELTAVQDELGAAAVNAFAARGPVPPFDHLLDFWDNFTQGPRVDGVPPAGDSVPELPTRLLDFELGFPFGVPACALTPHAGYIEYFAKRGFDLLTYKTVRDRTWNAHRFPQWAFAPQLTKTFTEVDVESVQIREPVVASLDPTDVPEFANASLVNSFGVPSLPVEQWKADVAESKSRLARGQVLIVSVMGSPDDVETRSDSDLIKQFVRTAAHAAEAGADIVELNLSCPNTGGELICTKPALSAQVAAAVKAELKTWGVPVLIKIGYLDSKTLTELVDQCQRYVEGIVAINTVPAKTVGGNEKPFFPSYRRSNGRVIDRPTAGVSGVAIRDLGLKTTRTLAELRDKNRAGSDWVIIGVGGVMTVADFEAYRGAGADAVQSCSGAWLNPRLALDIRNTLGRPASGGVESDSHRVASVLAKVGDLLATGGLSTRSRE